MVDQTDLKMLPDNHIVEIERRARRRLDQTVLAAGRVPGITSAHVKADKDYLAYVRQERERRGLQPSAIV